MACSSQWIARQRLPNPGAWAVRDEPLARLRIGLVDIYRYYRAGEPMLTQIHRDAEAVPPRVREARIHAQDQWAQVLLDPFPQRGSRVMQAAVAHAIAFDTWQSLCVGQRLSDRSAVDLLVGMVTIARQAVTGGRPSRA